MLSLKELKTKDLSYSMKIHCRQVGFDPSNRDESGGNAQEVHLLADDIAPSAGLGPSVPTHSASKQCPARKSSKISTAG